MISLLIVNVASWPWWWSIVIVLGRTFLQTGLFITAHDAMHGVLLPEMKRWNQRLGAVCLGLYAALPYQACLQNHQLHHHRPATADDPDFHADPAAGPWRWYRKFMRGYLRPGQMGRLLGFWGLLILSMTPWNRSAWMNLLLFYTLPLLLSSLQLFVFGTYLPHRDQRLSGEQRGPISLDHPSWLSLLTCFHFGYHREHHDHPQLAWFELPAQRQKRKPLTSGMTIRVASQRS
ncbi:MAG: fatty acid desaturase [Cyanobacteriota bacterium]